MRLWCDLEAVVVVCLDARFVLRATLIWDAVGIGCLRMGTWSMEARGAMVAQAAGSKCFLGFGEMT